MAKQSLGLAVGCVDVGDAGRVETAPGPIVGGIGPKLAGFDAAPAGIEHRHRRLVGEQLGPSPKLHEKALVQRAQMEGRACPTQSASVDRSRWMPWRA
jgi:hypothetical protein